MATNKDKEKEQEQLQEQGQEENTMTADELLEKAKEEAQAILEAAEKKNAEAQALLEKAKEAEAAAKKESDTTVLDKNQAPDPMEELVDYIAPLIVGKEDQAIFVQVNGENIRIQRGKKVRIKRKFKEVLDQSAEQEMAAYAFMEKVQRDSAKAAADLN